MTAPPNPCWHTETVKAQWGSQGVAADYIRTERHGPAVRGHLAVADCPLSHSRRPVCQLLARLFDVDVR